MTSNVRARARKINQINDHCVNWLREKEREREQVANAEGKKRNQNFEHDLTVELPCVIASLARTKAKHTAQRKTIFIRGEELLFKVTELICSELFFPLFYLIPSVLVPVRGKIK